MEALHDHRLRTAAYVVPLVYILGLLSVPYTLRGAIPAGWDTGIHLYYTRLVLDGDFDRLMGLARGNNVLPMVLVAALSLVMSSDIMLSRIVLTYVLHLALMAVYWWAGRRTYGQPEGGTLAVVFFAVWAGAFRLSADLHKTLLAYLFTLPVLVLYTRDDLSLRTRAALVAMMGVASLAQIELCVLVLGTAVLYEVWSVVVRRRTDYRRLLLLISLGLAVVPAFLLALSYSTYFISVAITYQVPLDAMAPGPAFVFLGIALAPLVVIGLLLTARDLLRRRRTSTTTSTSTTDRDFQPDLLHVFAVLIVFLLLIPSFFIAEPTLFRRMAPRAMVLLPVPVLVIDGIRWVYSLETTTPPHVHHRRVGFRHGVAIGLLSLVVMTGAVLPTQTVIYHDQYISGPSMARLRALAEHVDHNKTLVAVVDEYPVKAYRDYGWTGAYIGYCTYFNGPLHFLVAGVLYPDDNPMYKNMMNDQMARMRADGVQFPLTDPGVQIVFTEDFYGHPTTVERALSQEVYPGAYIMNASRASLLLRYYEVSPAKPFNTTGPWATVMVEDMPHMVLDDDDLTGNESVTYALVAYTGGTLRVEVEYMDYNATVPGIVLLLNGTRAASANYTGTMTPWTLTASTDVTSTSTVFLTVRVAGPGNGMVDLGQIYVYLTPNE